MNISLCKVTNQWFFHNRKSKCKEIVDQHNYHLQLDLSQLHSHISLFPEKEYELAMPCSQININSTCAANLLSLRDVLGLNNK